MKKEIMPIMRGGGNPIVGAILRFSIVTQLFLRQILKSDEPPVVMTSAITNTTQTQQAKNAKTSNA